MASPKPDSDIIFKKVPMITVSGNRRPWREGMTIADLMQELSDPYSYAVVRINDQYFSKPNFDKTMIPDESEIFLIPMIAGG
jgi:sulfur carrier protein